MTSPSTTRLLGRTGVPVSPLTLGAMNLGTKTGEDESVQIVHRAIDAGITVIDTADVYGRGASEELLGRALSGRRDEVFLATKFNGRMGDEPWRAGSSRRWIVQAVEDSLRRLNTDHIDLYQAHRPDPSTELEETLEALDLLVRQGKIRYYGTSVRGGDGLVEAQWAAERRGLIRPSTEQVPYSLLIRQIERSTLPVARRHGLGVLSYGPLAAGWLSGGYRRGAEQPTSSRAELIAGRYDLDAPQNEAKLTAATALAELAESRGLTLIELALGFVLSHPDISSVIVGPRTLAHLDSYVAASATVLDDETLDLIDRIVAPGTHFIERDNGIVLESLTPAGLRRR